MNRAQKSPGGGLGSLFRAGTDLLLPGGVGNTNNSLSCFLSSSTKNMTKYYFVRWGLLPGSSRKKRRVLAAFLSSFTKTMTK